MPITNWQYVGSRGKFGIVANGVLTRLLTKQEFGVFFVLPTVTGRLGVEEQETTGVMR
jgi:hypothetical protein